MTRSPPVQSIVSEEPVGHRRHRWRTRAAWVAITAASCACSGGPAPWDGPQLEEPRAQLTVDQLLEDDAPPFFDMSVLARPDWAEGDGAPLVGTVALRRTEFEMDFPETRALYDGEEVFPEVNLAFAASEGRLIPMERDLIATNGESDSLWDVIVGTGAAWREEGDAGWSRASFPLSLVDRFFNQVRNCVGSFVYMDDVVSNVFVQCSQETADAQDQQLGNLRAMVGATYAPTMPSEATEAIEAHEATVANRIPTRPLNEWDTDGEIAEYFDTSLLTRASTSIGAVYADGTLYVHPATTRHGPYPYPSEMRHGVYSVTKSMAGALSMFFLAERYGDEIFDALITDHVPALAERSDWDGVTFSHALNMATGTRGGEASDLLYEPLVLADTREQAIENIAGLGGAPEAPGQVFNYATTNTFVLSYALQRFVDAREGSGVSYWTLVRDNVLVPIGADGLDLLFTRDTEDTERIPTLGYGARLTIDQAAKVARLIANEGSHDGTQLLHRGKIREALGRSDWPGVRVNGQLQYRHSFWSRSVVTGTCRAEVSYMEGYGANHVLFLPSGVVVFRFMDENDDDLAALVRRVERVQSSCAGD